MKKEPRISIFHIEDRNASAAVIKARYGGRRYTVTGSAKREKGDAFDATIGGALAIARALRALAAALEANASVSVQQAETAKRRAGERLAHRRLERAHRRLASRPGARALLTLAEIEGKYGPEAAERARTRRAALIRAIH